MSQATYTFTSVVRRGFAARSDGVASVTVKVGGQPDLVRGVPMMSPADVVGIAPGQVIRTWPLDGVGNAEPNYLALVELDSPELPWLFSRPDAGGRVHPWLTLVVVDETDLDEDPVEQTFGGTTVTVPAEQRPDPAQAWLWAHGQLLGTESTVPADGTRSLARLVCPRRLEENHRYVACVVPSFDVGRRAGLGETVPPDDPARATATPSWTPAGELVLPVYHWWRFGTGPAGDFEALVRRLRGVPLPPGSGRRRLRLDHPLSTLPPSGTADLELHVALRPPGETTGPSRVRPDYVAALRQRLADADYDVSLLGDAPPHLGPPVHGQLPVGAGARADALGDAALPPWLSELNLDPRHRVAAGLGAEVVRRNQEHYVEQAWRQVGDVLAANRLRRRAEYSLATSTRLYQRWISRLDDGDLVTTTAPVHAKVGLAPGETVVGRLRGSPVPPAAASVELRRFARRRGDLSQGSGWQRSAGAEAVTAVSAQSSPFVREVRLDSVEVLEPPSVVWGDMVSQEILTRLVPEGTAALDPREAAARLDAVSEVAELAVPTKEEVLRAGQERVDLDRTLSVIGLLPVTTLTDVLRPGRRPPVRPPLRPPLHPPMGPSGFDRLIVRDVVDTVRVDPGLVTRVDDRIVLDTVRLDIVTRTGLDATTIDQQVFEQLVDGTFQPPTPAVADFAITGQLEREVSVGLREAVAAYADLVMRPGDSVAEPVKVLHGGLASLRPSLLEALDPRFTLPRAVNSRIAELLAPELEVFDDIMAAPDLSEPTYRQLAAISQDWLLPGLDALPADTTTLAAANLDFIAAFLVGMNHELARELLWREYPTDQRGTYARQFWTHVLQSEPDARFDLKQELHKARRSSLRGLTRKAGAPEADDPLVLVVKGDLVQRYPGLILTAAQTEQHDGVRVPRGAALQPDFVGRLEPDVLLAGFTGLTAEEVRTKENGSDPDQKWWFFFAEHFGEPRFGLDATSDGAATTWNDAAWSHLPADVAFLGPSSFTGARKKGDGKDPTFTWGSTSATQAWITLQFPFRLGIPAGRLLPPEAPDA